MSPCEKLGEVEITVRVELPKADQIAEDLVHGEVLLVAEVLIQHFIGVQLVKMHLL